LSDVESLLRIGGFQVPDEDECARLQAYWDELSAQGRSVRAGSGEIALSYAVERPEDG
jgi:hypothetical protein